MLERGITKSGKQRVTRSFRTYIFAGIQAFLLWSPALANVQELFPHSKLEEYEHIMELKNNTTRDIIASQNQDYVDEGLAEYQDQIQKLQCKFFFLHLF